MAGSTENETQRTATENETQTRWSIACAGGYVNVRSMLIGDLAEQIVGHEASALEPPTPVLEESAVRAALRQVGGPFAEVAHHRALHQSLLQLFRELRRSEIGIEHPPSEMARAAVRAFETYERLIAGYLERCCRCCTFVSATSLAKLFSPSSMHHQLAARVCPAPPGTG